MMLHRKDLGTVAAAPRSEIVGFGDATSLHTLKTALMASQGGAWGKSQPRRLRMTASSAGSTFTVTGQCAKALLALVEAGNKGVTALDVATWAYRLGAYVHTLRHAFGLVIELEREKHDGGWHGRYMLRSPVEVLEVQS